MHISFSREGGCVNEITKPTVPLSGVPPKPRRGSPRSVEYNWFIQKALQ